jgi:hypothetical protein
MAATFLRKVAFAFLFISCAPYAAALEATLTTTTDFAPVGTAIRLEANAITEEGGIPWYRFRIWSPEGRVAVIRDFGPEAALDWAASGREGTYEIELTTRDTSSGNEITSFTNIELTSRVLDGQPAIAPTSHPLVFLYSAPPCPAGSRMRVEFQAADGNVKRTPSKDCDSAYSMNFYLAGLYQDTSYTAKNVLECNERSVTSEPVTFTTGKVSGVLYPANILQAAPSSSTNQVLLINGSGAPTATDLNGNILWYTTGIQFITRVEPDGYFWTINEGPHDPARSVIRKFDLLGNVVLETNAARVNEQLRALGKREISGFHHEALTLPDGRVAALAGSRTDSYRCAGPRAGGRAW